MPSKLLSAREDWLSWDAACSLPSLWRKPRNRADAYTVANREVARRLALGEALPPPSSGARRASACAPCGRAFCSCDLPAFVVTLDDPQAFIIRHHGCLSGRLSHKLHYDATRLLSAVDPAMAFSTLGRQPTAVRANTGQVWTADGFKSTQAVVVKKFTSGEPRPTPEFVPLY
jgi:hypothetical protein